MTVHIHRPQLEELLSNLADVIDGSDDPYELANELERLGVCSNAVGNVAEVIADAAMREYRAGGRTDLDTHRLLVNAYANGVAIGLLAAERIGR